MMDYIIYTVGFLYLLNAIYYFTGIVRLKRSKHGTEIGEAEQYFISVIVPARNEEKNLPQTLESISIQDYPSNLWELIIVDDGSTDKTRTIAEKAASENSHIKVVSNTRNSFNRGHKKNAVQLGVEHAKGE